MSEYDVPAMLEYINKETGKKVNYVGHSQGTLLMFAALADKTPKVKEYLQSFIALGPVFYLTNIKTCGIKTLSETSLVEVMQKVGYTEFLAPNWLSSTSASFICRLIPSICRGALTLMFDSNPGLHDNSCRYKIWVGHFPAGTSTQDIVHWKQVIQGGNGPRKFDFGAVPNLQKYTTVMPPAYDLKNIDIPVYLFAGTSDKVSVPADYRRLHKDLPKSELKEYDLGHMTFVMADDMSYFKDVMETLKKVN